MNHRHGSTILYLAEKDPREMVLANRMIDFEKSKKSIIETALKMERNKNVQMESKVASYEYLSYLGVPVHKVRTLR